MSLRPHRALMVALVLAAGMGYYYFALLIPHVRIVHAQRQLNDGVYFGSDFYPIWRTTRELIKRGLDPYSAEMTRVIQTALFGRPLDPSHPDDPPPSYHAFSYPLYIDSLAVPFAWLPFSVVRIVLSLIFPVFLSLAVLLWLRALGPPLGTTLQAAVVLLVLISYPALEAMFLEQPSVVVVVLLAGATWALVRNKLALAGTLLGLAWIKPHLVVLLTLWLAVWAVSDWPDRKPFVLGFAVTLGTLLAGGALVLPGWFPAWQAAMVEYRNYTEPPLVLLVTGKWLGTTTWVTLLCLGALLAWDARRDTATNANFHFVLAFLLAVTVVCLPSGNAVYEQLLLVPALVWLGVHHRQWAGSSPSSVIARLGLAMALWPPALATLVTIASWLRWPAPVNPAALSLPLRTASSFPFVLLAALSLSRYRPGPTQGAGVLTPKAPTLFSQFRVPSGWTKYLLPMAALLLSLAMGYYHEHIFTPNLLAERARKNLAAGYSIGNDFYPIWLTTREWLLHHRDPYSDEMTRAIQQGLFGRALTPPFPDDPPANYRAFAYPAYVDLLAVPLAKLSFNAVRWTLAFALPLLTGASILFWLRFLKFPADRAMSISMFALTLFSYPVLEGLYAQQLGLIAGFLLATSMEALRRRRFLLSGSLLGLAVIKPQMTVLVIVFLLLWTVADWANRKRLALGCGTVITLLLLCSIIVWPRWIPEWLGVVRSYGDYGTPPLVTHLLGQRLGPPVIWMMLAGTVWLAWRLRREAVESLGFKVGICTILAVTSITLLPGHALYDRVILLPGIFLLVQFRHTLFTAGVVFRLLLVTAALALFWQWIFAAVVVFAEILLPPVFWNNAFFLLLPIRTAGTVPFAVAGILALILRDLRCGKLSLQPAGAAP